MASVAKVRQIQIEHPNFVESLRCVEVQKKGFTSIQNLHTNHPEGQEYTAYDARSLSQRFATPEE